MPKKPNFRQILKKTPFTIFHSKKYIGFNHPLIGWFHIQEPKEFTSAGVGLLEALHEVYVLADDEELTENAKVFKQDLIAFFKDPEGWRDRIFIEEIPRVLESETLPDGSLRLVVQRPPFRGYRQLNLKK